MSEEKPWYPSHREEVISSLFFIAACCSKMAEFPPWLWKGLLVKAALDTLCVLTHAIKELREEN